MTATEHGVVIVGSGAAGHSCARALRAQGFAGRIRLVHGEPGPAINRTLVDKGVLPGLLTGEQIALPALSDVEVIPALAVELRSSPPAVVLDDGSELQGDALVVASGSVPRALDRDVEVDPSVRLHVLHGVADAEELRGAIPEPAAARVVILGAGFIGAEVASHFAGAGAQVTLVGRSRLPLRAAVGDEIAVRIAALHADRVDARLGVGVRVVRSAGRGRDAAIVELEDGSRIEADAVVVAVGSRADTGWAGFEGAIAVDDRFRMPTAPGVYAVGSASAPELDGVRTRVDHWDAATSQGAHAARTVLHDLSLGDDPGPWRPTTGFSLMAHGAVIAARGVRAADAHETSEQLENGGMLARFSTASGRLTGVAGFNAGPHIARAAASL